MKSFYSSQKDKNNFQLLSQQNNFNNQPKLINPRSSYQQEHSDYFKKLQQQLLQKSNRYASLIGKKNILVPGNYKNQANLGQLNCIQQQKPTYQVIKNKRSQISQPNRKQTTIKNKSFSGNMSTPSHTNLIKDNIKSNNNIKISSNQKYKITYPLSNSLQKPIKQTIDHAINNVSYPKPKPLSSQENQINIQLKNCKHNKQTSTEYFMNRKIHNNIKDVSPLYFSNNVSLTNLYSALDSLQPKKCQSRQQTERTQNSDDKSKLKTNNYQTKAQPFFHHNFYDQFHNLIPEQNNFNKQNSIKKQTLYSTVKNGTEVGNFLKYQKLNPAFPNQINTLQAKIDKIKSLINNFYQTTNTIKPKNKTNIKNLKLTQIPKKQSSSIQLQRILAYNLTFQNPTHPNFIEDTQSGLNLCTLANKQTKNSTSNLSTSTDKYTKSTQYKKSNNLQSFLVQTVSTKNSITNNPTYQHQCQRHFNNQSSNVSLIFNQNTLNTFNPKSQNLNQTNKSKQPQEQSQQGNEQRIEKNNSRSFQLSERLKRLSLRNAKQLNISISKVELKDFILLSQIGQGKMGLVYMVKHVKSNFICALKVINKSILNQNVLVQLIRQIKTQSYLDHPNIVQLYGVFSDNANVYLLMELCFGGNIYTHLRKQKILPETQIKTIVRQVCFALEYMHDNEIIHRDLKPQNILLHQNIVKICDLGWAVYSPLPRDTLCGTPIYVSPELVEKKKYGNKIDVWNVGILTFQLLCGRVPFQIRSQEDLHKVITEDIHFPKSIPISQYCKDFINLCLKKIPQKRYSISQLLQHPFLA